MQMAVIVAGNEERFTNEADLTEGFLRKRVGLQDVTVIRGGLVKGTPAKRLAEVVDRAGEDDVLLLAYTGHGYEGGWLFGESDHLSYEELGKILSNCRSSILLINDCCHAMCISVLRNVPSRRVGLIAACDADETTINDLLTDVIDQWRRRKVFSPIKIIHCGVLNGRDLGRPRETVVGGFRAWLAHQELFVEITLPRIKVEISFMHEWIRDKKRVSYEGIRKGPVFDHLFFPS